MSDFTDQEQVRPAACTNAVLTYLDDLRSSGVTNMFGAAPYLQAEFALDQATAKACLIYWMHTFSDRHPQA